MTNYPEFAEIRGKRYKINTDFRAALECEKISESNISDEERAMAIIYVLFGDEGLDDAENWGELLQVALKYLNCGNEPVTSTNAKEINMSFEEDWSYIQASFFSDYNIDLSKSELHWWLFFDLLCGLTEKCILNRVRFVRDFDITQIKDSKEREKWIKQKKQVALKKKFAEKTPEQIRLDQLFEKQLKGR